MAEDLEEDYDEEAEGESSGGGGKSKKLLLIILPVLLLIGAGAGAYFAGLFGGSSGDEKKADEHAAPAEAGHGGEKGAATPAGTEGEMHGAVFYDIPEMLVDINSAGRKRSFLKIRVSLELAAATDVPVIESVMPRIVDNFQVYLRELRLEDLQGAEGIYRLREELLVRVNAAVRPAKVNDVLFKEMLIQ